MKTTIVPLIGSLEENLYQLGMKEKDAFKELEDRVSRLFSTSEFLRQGHGLIGRLKQIFKNEEQGLFEKAIQSYALGLGIETSRYLHFLSLFEYAAHFGQAYPELKSLLPGCTSVFSKNEAGLTHSRLLDFPLIGIFDLRPRLYYWQITDRPTILSYSCEGLAPLMLQGVHGSGMSFALHNKPGENFHKDGQNIFSILFETLFDSANINQFKKEVKKHKSVTKWSIITLTKEGQLQALDIDGGIFDSEVFNLNETSPVIYTNVPLKEGSSSEHFLQFSSSRQAWVKQKLSKKSKKHQLDLLLDVNDQLLRNWQHPASTLSTVGALEFNLEKGYVDVKEGESALTASDAIIRFSLANRNEHLVLKEKEAETDIELAWKRASRAQMHIDRGHYDLAYHELQMARDIMPLENWKEVLQFYIFVLDYKFVTNKVELSSIYNRLLKLEVPDLLKDLKGFLLMRYERTLGLISTVHAEDISPELREHFTQEQKASKPVFTTWMKLLYPRLEILDVLSPHHQ